jgi:hypothetical protein
VLKQVLNKGLKVKCSTQVPEYPDDFYLDHYRMVSIPHKQTRCYTDTPCFWQITKAGYLDAHGMISLVIIVMHGTRALMNFDVGKPKGFPIELYCHEYTCAFEWY